MKTNSLDSTFLEDPMHFSEQVSDGWKLPRDARKLAARAGAAGRGTLRGSRAPCELTT
jgi:hypothetical protein